MRLYRAHIEIGHLCNLAYLKIFNKSKQEDSSLLLRQVVLQSSNQARARARSADACYSGELSLLGSQLLASFKSTE